MMIAHVLIILFTLTVVAIIWYAVANRDGGQDKKKARRVVDRKASSSAPPGGQPAREGAGRASEISFPPPEGSDEALHNPQACLKEGIDMIFSPVSAPTEEVPAPLTIAGVRGDVGLRVLSHIASLKNFDSIHRLQRMMGDPKTSVKDLTGMITSNPLLSAKILQIANSAYYGMQQKINSISHAIMIIGMVNIKAIIYHEGVLQVLNEKSFRDNPTMKTVWQHANYTSIYASYLHYLFGDLNMGTLFTLGLLHDIGKFILVKQPPILAQDDGPVAYGADLTIAEEERIYGINHALIGQMALQNWGLSQLIIKTVALHHAPASHGADTLGVDQQMQHYLLILFLADQAARIFAGCGDTDVRVDRLHPSYLGMIDRQKLSQLVVDKSLLGQLREAEAITNVYA